MKLLAVSLLVSLALHSLLLLVSWPSYTPEEPPTPSMVEFIPVSKMAPVAVAEAAPEPMPELTPEPVPTPKPSPQPAETTSDTASADEQSADSMEANIGELDIAVADDKPVTADDDKPVTAAEEPEPATKPEPEKIVEPEPVLEPEDTVEPEPEPEAPAETLEEPAEQVAPVEPAPIEEKSVAEPDRRVDVPVVASFVSDRISGEIEFKGKGRRLSRDPAAPDFRLSNNAEYVIKFKVNSTGRPIDIIIPPMNPELERTLRAFVEQMRFSAVLYDEPDEATLTINLQVR